MQQRNSDITPLEDECFDITINNQSVHVAEGETVLSAMFAIGERAIMENDHQIIGGAYCGMGVCHCCLVTIDGQYKHRACKTAVYQGMKVDTQSNRFKDIGIKD